MKNLFTPGQEVVCIHDDWFFAHCHMTNLPIKNEIYTVDQIKTIAGKWYVSLRQLECDCWFTQNAFAPVMPHDQLVSELLSIFQPITII